MSLYLASLAALGSVAAAGHMRVSTSAIAVPHLTPNLPVRLCSPRINSRRSLMMSPTIVPITV